MVQKSGFARFPGEAVSTEVTFVMKKQTVLVLFGGISNEYDVSLRSAVSIIENLDRGRFEAVPVGITRTGRWLKFDGPAELIAKDRWQEGAVRCILSPDRHTGGLLVGEPDGAVTVLPVDVIFPAVHGQNCEDGALQGLMELSGIPYVGSPVTASAVCFDKEFTHIIAERHGIPMARWLSAVRGEDPAAVSKRIEESFGYPVFVKPANSGSSVGVSRAKGPEELPAALERALREDWKALVEEEIAGREVECAVTGNLATRAPTVGEIACGEGFYDYDSKYISDGAAKLYIPARISGAQTDEIRSLAQKVYRALGCRGYSRVDFFALADGRVLLNEINTLPGFTSISMYPKMMMSSGISYPELLSELIDLAIEAKKEGSAHG